MCAQQQLEGKKQGTCFRAKKWCRLMRAMQTFITRHPFDTKCRPLGKKSLHFVAPVVPLTRQNTALSVTTLSSIANHTTVHALIVFILSRSPHSHPHFQIPSVSYWLFSCARQSPIGSSHLSCRTATLYLFGTWNVVQLTSPSTPQNGGGGIRNTPTSVRTTSHPFFFFCQTRL